uniref:Cytochrome c oxidase subunit 7A1 n=1 Tax=Dicentrarchus labrax TaxID=13489 RepID=A0A8C4F6A7_DICLA
MKTFNSSYIILGSCGHLLTCDKLPVLASRAFSSSARQLKNKVPEAQKLFQLQPLTFFWGTSLRRSDVLLMCLSAGTCYSLYWLLMASMPQKKA